jgi:predicted nucleic acid-binding protein
MPEYLLDSCVLIQHLRGHNPTTVLLSELSLTGQLGIAAISRTEIIEGMRDHEREATLQFLDALTCYTFDATIADQTGELIRQYRAQGITLSKPDAMIAATAIYHNAVVLTYNPRHFSMLALQLYDAMPAL